jgi:hypothetical protein
MLIRSGNTFINTLSLVSGHIDKNKLLIKMSTGVDHEFEDADAEYLKTILDAIAYTDVHELNKSLPQTKKPAQEF